MFVIYCEWFSGKFDRRARTPRITKKLPAKWMKEENRRMSGMKKEGKTTEGSRIILKNSHRQSQ